jgi:lysyl-tRNA synthetase class 1
VRSKGLYEYVHKLEPPKQPTAHFPYRFLSQQAALFPADGERVNKVFARLLKYGMAKEMTKDIVKRIELTSNWADDSAESYAEQEKFDVKISETQHKALVELTIALEAFRGASDSPDNAKSLQSKVFEISRENGIEPKDFFTLLYRIFLNAERGPRIGNYFLDLGIDRVLFTLKKYL